MTKGNGIFVLYITLLLSMVASLSAMNVNVGANAHIEELRLRSSTSQHLTSRDQLPLLENNEEIQVFYLETPLFKNQFGNIFESLNGFHGGVGFRVMSSGKEYMLEYYATISVLAAVFPTLESNNKVKWNNGATVDVDYKIDGWQRSQLIATINGEQFNKFACWAPTYLNQGSNRAYQLFNVYESWPDGQRYLHASTCVDFVWACFETLHDITGVVLNPVTHPRHDFVNFYSNQSVPVAVDYSDPATQQKIWDFYNSFSVFLSDSSKNKTVIEIIESIMDVINGEAYVYVVDPSPATSGGKYYKIQLVSPYVGYEYDAEIMPSGVPDPTRIPAGCKTYPVASPSPSPSPGPQLTGPFTKTGVITIAAMGGVLGAFVLGFAVSLTRKKPNGDGTNLSVFNSSTSKNKNRGKSGRSGEGGGDRDSADMAGIGPHYTQIDDVV